MAAKDRPCVDEANWTANPRFVAWTGVQKVRVVRDYASATVAENDVRIQTARAAIKEADFVSHMEEEDAVRFHIVKTQLNLGDYAKVTAVGNVVV